MLASTLLTILILASTPAPAAEAEPGALDLYSRALLSDTAEMALHWIEEALLVDPDSAFLHEEAALMHREVGNREEAVREAERAVELDDDSRKAHTLLAPVYFHMSQFGGDSQLEYVNKSIYHFEAVTRLEPHVLESWRALAQLYELRARLDRQGRSEDLERAVGALRQWQGAAPEEAVLNGARILAELGNWEEATSWLRTALIARPAWPEALLLLGEVLEGTSEWEGAADAYRRAMTLEPEDWGLRFRLGRALERGGRTDEALALLEGGDAGLPDSVRMQRLLFRARLEERLGDYPAAEADYRDVLVDFPNLHEARYELARFYDRRGDQGRSRQELDKLLGGIDQGTEVWVEYTSGAGDILMGQGRIEEGLELIESAYRARPRLGRSALRLATAYMDVGDYTRAHRLLVRHRIQSEEPGLFWILQGQVELMRDDVPSGRRTLQSYLRRMEDSSEALRAVALAYSGAGMHAEGERYLDLAGEATNDLEVRHELLVRRAQALSDAGLLPDAERVLLKILDERPYETRAVGVLVHNVLLPQGRSEDAVEVLEATRAARPDDSELEISYLEALLECDRVEDALALARELRKETPRELRYTAAVVRALAAAGKGEEGVAEALAALAGPSGDLPLGLLLANSLQTGNASEEAGRVLEWLRERYGMSDALAFALGVLEERSGRVEAAITHLEEALERNSAHHHAMNYLGYLYADRGERLEEAERLVLEALRLSPHNPAYLDSLGWVYFQQGRFRKAQVPLAEAAQRLPGDAVIRMHLGRLYDQLGWSQEALAEYLQALSSGLDERREEVQARVGVLQDSPLEDGEMQEP